VLEALDQLAHRNTEKLAIVEIFIRPMGLVCRHHLPPAIRQGDTGIENPLEAAQRMRTHLLQKRRMDDLAYLKPDRAADTDRHVAIVRGVKPTLAFGDDAARLDRDTEPDAVAVLVLGKDPAQQHVAERVLGLGQDHQRCQLGQTRRSIRRPLGGEGGPIAEFLIRIRRTLGRLDDMGFARSRLLGRRFGSPLGALGTGRRDYRPMYDLCSYSSCAEL
jgi:hypothetical protein